jgi:hypothetical protein
MPNDVYDKEDEQTLEGYHDDLGVHPERREAEVDDLERQFDMPSATPEAEEEEKPARSLEQDAAGGGYLKSLPTKKRQSQWSKAEANERKDLDDRVGKIKDQIGEPDSKASGLNLFRKEGDKSRLGGLRGASGILKNRKAMLGVGGGVLGMIFTIGIMFNFLHTFQFDHFFKNTEAKASQRLQASLSTRNKYLVGAYIKVRAAEIEGKAGGTDNLYFRASKVDGGSPFMTWYKTMRASKFESDLYQKQGIAFTSLVDKDGKIKIAQITRSDGADQDLIKKYGLDKLTENSTPNDLVGVMNGITNQDDLDKLFTVSAFDSHKEARSSVRQAVNTQVPWWRTFKRRHARTDISNETGMKSWRLFETTRDKIALKEQDKKNQLLNKVIDRYYAKNPGSAQFLKCLFSDGRCSSNTDPASPDDKTNVPATGSEADKELAADTQAQNAEKPKDPPTSTNLDTAGVGSDITQAIDKSVEDGVTAVSTDAASEAVNSVGPGKQIILALTRTLSGEAVSDAVPINPTKIWTWAKRLAKIDGLFRVAGAAGSGLSNMVTKARRAQVVGLYGTYASANDQMKSGKLVPDELNAFFDTTKNLGNSEGWAQVAGESVGDPNNPTRNDYCAKPPDQRPPNDFAWQCDEQKPGNGGTGQSLSETYTNSVGPVIAPIAGVVNIAGNAPPAKLLDWFNEEVGKVTGLITDPVIQKVMDSSLGTDIKTMMSTVMSKLLGFLGAGPMFDGTQPGLGNLLVAGAAASAEDSTRASGGVAQTNITKAYSNKLAANMAAEQRKDESLYNRYASLSSDHSLASSALFTVASDVNNMPNTFSRLSSAFMSLPSFFGNAISGRAFAANQSPTSLADWAGLKKYDVPEHCVTLDPLSSDYLAQATNAPKVLADNGIAGFSVDMSTLRDTNKFSTAVYGAIGDNPKAQDIAEQIYDCALFDARSMGDLGAVYGYTDDNGYKDVATSQAPATTGSSNPNLYVLGDSLTAGMRDAGDLEKKFKDQGWQNVTISAQCGRHLKIDGVSCPGTLVDAKFPGGFQQADKDTDAIKNAGTIVIGLGTNDAGDGGFSDNVSGMIDKVRAVNTNAKIYWINLYTTDDSGPKFPPMNQILTTLSASKNFTVIDWATAAPPNYDPGNIHPSKHYPDMATFVVNTVGAPAPTSTGVEPSDGGGVVPGDAVQTALGLAWDTRLDADGTPRVNKSDAKPSYQAAEPKYNGWPENKDPKNTMWSDCGVFVSTVMRASGVDPNYPQQGTSRMIPYLKSHPEKYKMITDNAVTSEGMQPGDIIINDDHTMLFVGEQPKGYDTTDASLGDRVPGAKIFAPYPDKYKTSPTANYNYMVFRVIKK